MSIGDPFPEIRPFSQPAAILAGTAGRYFFVQAMLDIHAGRSHDRQWAPARIRTNRSRAGWADRVSTSPSECFCHVAMQGRDDETPGWLHRRQR